MRWARAGNALRARARSNGSALDTDIAMVATILACGRLSGRRRSIILAPDACADATSVRALSGSGPVAVDTDDVLEQAARWRADGRTVALATVVRTWGSRPRP